MIIVKLIGGLGNQMFQYALGYRLAKQSDTELKIDIAGFKKYKLHKVAVHHLNTHYEESVISYKDINRLTNTYGVRGFLRSYGILKPSIKIIEEKGQAFQPAIISKYNEDVYLDGFWQSEKYFKPVEDEIRDRFRVITPPSMANQQMISKIQTTNAISVHIRRADYVTNKKTLSYHGICDMEYYLKAAGIIKSKIKDPVFFIFSDDIEWAKKNIDFAAPQFFADMNDAATNYEDLRLMYSCRHHIIANSSFSWWGAWLNPAKEKIVIGPQKWFNIPENDSSDIIPDEWIKI